MALQSRKDLGPEPAAQDAVAANARAVDGRRCRVFAGHRAVQHAPELAEPLTTFADQLQTIAQYYLAGMNNNDPEQAARLAAADETTATLPGSVNKVRDQWDLRGGGGRWGRHASRRPGLGRPRRRT